MRRLLVTVIGLLTVWFGFVEMSSAMANSTLPPTAYGYDSRVTIAPVGGMATERGPPAAYDHDTTYGAIDHRSHGAWVREDGTTPAIAFTYDHSAPLAQAASVSSATHMGAVVASDDLRAPSGASVAANTGTKLGWSTGDDIYSLTKAGNNPAWSTVRGRFWKNEASSPKYGSWTDDQLARMRTGRAPQRYNPDKGGMESMDLSHEPIPFRDGGTSVIPRWPQDHAAVDPFRHPGY